MIGGDQPFPHRHLILFLTFSVIVVTLVVQGPVLPWLVRKLGLTDLGSKEQLLQQQQEADARLEAARAAFVRLPELSVEINLPAEQIRQVRELHRDRVSQLEHRRDLCGEGSEVAARVDCIELALIQTEREYVNGLLRSARISDEIRRRIERELDLREEVIQRRLESNSESASARASTGRRRM